MCGISGIIKYGKEPISSDHVELLLVGLQKRGNDATGVALQYANGHWVSYKNNVPAWNFVTSNEFVEWMKEKMTPEVVAIIAHTRAATQGTPRDAANNHPLTSEHCALVHNGMISNETTLFSTLKLKRQGEVDSDILRAIVEEYGITAKGVDNLNKVNGSAAIAAFHTKFPGKVLIARSGSPLTIGSTSNFFAFASEKHILHRAMRPFVKRFGVDFQVQSVDMAFSPFPDNTAWIMGPHGLEGHFPFRTLTGVYRTPDYAAHVAKYEERQKRWEGTGKTEVKHTTGLLEKHVRCTCGKDWTIHPSQTSKPLPELECTKAEGGCGRTMTNGAVRYVVATEKETK